MTRRRRKPVPVPPRDEVTGGVAIALLLAVVFALFLACVAWIESTVEEVGSWLESSPAVVPYDERVDGTDTTTANPSDDNGCWRIGLGTYCFDTETHVPTPPAILEPRVLAECGVDRPCTHDRECADGWCVECQYSSSCPGALVCKENECVLPDPTEIFFLAAP